MSQFHFKMLGPFSVSSDGAPIALPRSKKARALLAYLATKRRPQSKTHLATLFFAETSDPKGGLRWCISRLRAALGKDFITSDKQTVALAWNRLTTDIDQLANIDGASNQETLTGEFLADLTISNAGAYQGWRLAESVACNKQRAEYLTGLARGSLGNQKAVDAARTLVDLDNSRESSWALLVKALLSANELSEARNVQRLAVEQLQHDGIRLSGKLENVWLANSAKSPQSGIEDLTHSNSALGLKPRIAILDCQSTRKDGKPLADAITDVAFRACNVSKTVTVLSPTTSVQLEHHGAGVVDAARELGIDYILASTLSRRNKHFLVDADLVATETGVTQFRWTKSYAENERNAVGDRLEAYLSARMEIDLPIALIAKTREKPTELLTARDMYLMALPRMFSADGFDPIAAHDLLENALSQQPYFGQACVALALIRMFMPQCNDDTEQLEITLSLARRAVEICQDDAFALGVAAVTIGHIAKDTDTGIDLARRALSINPYSVMGGVAAAMTNHYQGNDIDCLRYIDTVEANTDTDPISFFCYTCRAMAHYQLEQYDEALKWSRNAVGHNPKFVIALRYLLASLAQLDQTEEANELAAKIAAIDPTENIAFFQRRSAYRCQSATDHLCDGLRKAGLPEN